MAHPVAEQATADQDPGYTDRTLWAPDMCFPIERSSLAAPTTSTTSTASTASSLHLSGGPRSSRSGPKGCATAAALLPLQDTFCANRSATNVFCKGGLGRQGVDLLTNTCANGTPWAVAADSGLVSNVSRVAVTLTSDKPPYRQYRYLRLDMSQLSALEGDRVLPGDRIGKIRSNPAGMGFEIRVPIDGVNANGRPVSVLTVVPPYSSLVAANNRRLKGDDCR